MATTVLRFFFVAPRKNAIQCTLWLYLPHRAGILLSWFF
ncbi:transposase [Escherichia fergusonii]|nr:transposase [Escherichia fergusonii]